MKNTKNSIDSWLDHYGDPEIEKQVELEIKEIRQMQYTELEALVEVWAHQKGILEKATPIKQLEKTEEEVAELREAIETNNREELIDSLGDILVTLIIQAKMQDLDLVQCLQTAYNVISKRTGKMVDGQFVKDE